MKQILKLSALTMVLLLVCALFAGAITKFENGAYEVNGIVDIDSVALEITNGDLDMNVGDTQQLSVDVVGYKSGEEVQRQNVDASYFTWSFEGDGVIEVESGLVSAVGEGSATVTASYIYNEVNYEASINVTVTDPNIMHILVVEPATANLFPNEQQQLSVYEGTLNLTTYEEVKGDQLSASEVQWTSGDGNIVTVDDSGLVTAVAEGETYVMATKTIGEGNQVGGSCEITVIPPLPSFHIEMESNLTMTLGSTYQLNPEIVEGDAKVSSNKATMNSRVLNEFTFSCSSHSTVGVDNTGLLTAKKIGKATVKCKCNDLEATCQVEVVHPTYTIDAPDEIDVVWGEKVNLGATVTPNVGSLTYITKNEAIASVSKYGNVKGQSIGQTKVITLAPDGKTKKETKVNVIYPDYTIDIDTRGLTLYGGQTAQINATLTPNKGSLKWKTSDKSIATVDAKGLVTARNKVTGQCEIMCIAPDGQTMATVSVQVYRAEYTGLEVEEEMYLIGGEKQRIGYTLTPNKGKCTWVSKDERMATVNMYGTVTAKRGVEGVVIIVCTSPDGLMQKECIVHISKN